MYQMHQCIYITLSTRIASCSTRFSKVKFRLNMTQLETLLNSCPDGDLMGTIVQGELFRGNYPGGIIQG